MSLPRTPRHLLHPEDRPALRVLKAREQALLSAPAARGDGDCSSRAMTAVHVLVNVGYGDDEILLAAQDRRFPALYAYANERADGRPHTRQNADRRILRMVGKSRARLAEGSVTSPSEARQALGLVMAAVEEHRWSGQSGATDLVVLRCLLRLANQASSVEVGISSRRLSLLSGTAERTARTSLARLVAAGWLAKTGGWTPTTGQTYVLHPVHVRPSEASTSDVCEFAALDSSPGARASAAILHTSTHAGSDAYVARGLGRSALLVLATVHAAPGSTVGELVAGSGRHRTTVQRALRALIEAGQVVETDGRYAVPVEPTSDEDVALTLGTDGTADRRRLAYAHQRAAFRLARGVYVLDPVTWQAVDPKTGEVHPLGPVRESVVP